MTRDDLQRWAAQQSGWSQMTPGPSERWTSDIGVCYFPDLPRWADDDELALALMRKLLPQVVSVSIRYHDAAAISVTVIRPNQTAHVAASDCLAFALVSALYQALEEGK